MAISPAIALLFSGQAEIDPAGPLPYAGKTTTKTA